MKSKLLAAGFCSLMLLAAPAFAATTSNDAARTDNAARTNMANNTAAGQNNSADQIVAQSVTPLRQVKSDQYFNNLMKRAKGVVIVPHLFKGAVGVGGSGGTGVLLGRQGNHWSDPAFISIGSISVGPQVGAKEGPVVMLLMTDKALNDFTQRNNFSLNANAGLTVINYSAKGQGGFGKGDVVVWSGTGGAFVGASVSGSDVTADTQQDANFYGRSVTTNQIVKGQVQASNPAATRLRDALPT